MGVRNQHILVSRDSRTANSFRLAWRAASENVSDYPPLMLNRRDSNIIYFLGYLIFQKFRGNVVFAFGISEMLLLGFLRPHIGIVTGFGRLLLQNSKYRKAAFSLLKVFYKDRLVFVLNSTDARILKALGFNKVKHINGEGYQRKINPLKIEKAKFNKIRLLYVGRLLKSKGVERLIDEFRDWSDSCPGQLELYLVGDSDFNNADSISESYIEETNAAAYNNIIFCGYSTDLTQFVNDRTIFVSLSEREGMPFSVLEMLDCGIPCILSRVAGHIDLAEIENVIIIKSNSRLCDIDMKSIASVSRKRSELVDKYSATIIERDISEILKRELLKI